MIIEFIFYQDLPKELGSVVQERSNLLAKSFRVVFFFFYIDMT